MRLVQSAALVVAGLACWPRLAVACGTSGPDGVSACSLADYEEAQRPRWRVGLSGIYTSTVIHFSNTLQTGETRSAALAEVSYAPTRRLSLSAGLGVAVGGSILAPDGRHDFTPGSAAGLGIAYRLVDGATPLGHGFLQLSAAFSYTGASTERGSNSSKTSYNALDLRAGAAAGFTWFRVLSGYVVGRGFGGPVYWSYRGNSELGTDTHHYQVGGGVAWLIARRVDVYAEGVPLGEQAVAAGLSVAF